MGTGIVDELKKEFPIEDEWVAYELHPEFPPEGVLLSERFPGLDLPKMYEKLRKAGKPYNLEFGPITKTSNSRLALEASEFARDRGQYDSFHHRVFRAFFTEVRDIGDLDILLDLAKDEGLDADALSEALQEGHYAGRLENARGEAHRLGITAVPTFIIDGEHRIVGAPSIDQFKSRLKSVQARRSS